jgi:biopolymer transport protein ExbB/biopolymer transport protein TolQ
MGHGLTSLATIASLAPFVGLFGTVLGIMNSFRAIGQPNSHLLGFGAVAHGISESLATTALGLLVAIPAVWFYHYLRGQLEGFDAEMESWNSLVPRKDS